MGAIAAPSRLRDQIKVVGGAEVYSPGRLFTRTIIGRYHSDYFDWLCCKVERDRAEIAHYLCHGWFRDARRLLDKLEDLEWTLAETSRMGGLGMSEATGNLALNEGWDNDCWQLIAGTGSPTTYNNANAQTGVGDSTTAAAATQTDLQAAVNKTYKGMVASYPAAGGATTRRMDFRSDYVSGDANYAWQEFIVRNGATDLTDMLRVVSAQGTKTAGQTWTLTVQVSIT